MKSILDSIDIEFPEIGSRWHWREHLRHKNYDVFPVYVVMRTEGHRIFWQREKGYTMNVSTNAKAFHKDLVKVQ